VLQHQQRRRLGTVGTSDDSNITNDRQHVAPGKGQPLAEMALHPIRHELAGHDDLELAGVAVERAELSRLQPSVKGASAAVPAQPGANGFPGGFKWRRHRCGIGDTQIFPTALHWRAPSLTRNLAGHEKPSCATRFATPKASSVSSPPVRIRRRKVRFESLARVIQVPNFHQCEINRLDRGKPPIPAENGCFKPYRGDRSKTGFCESRESLDFFQSPN